MSGPAPPPRLGLSRFWRPEPTLRLIDRLAAPLDDMLKVLVAEAGVGIAIVDREGVIVRVNDSLRRMVGPKCDVAPGRPAKEIFCEERHAETWAEITPALQGARPSCSFTALLRKRDGAQATVSVSAVALREVDGAITGVILQLSDISAQRRLEAQLAQSQKLQAVGQLAAGIAHDFNNLLTAMIGAADDALERRPTDPATLEDLQQIRTSAERGADLVRQLLAFGRQQALEPRVLAINDAVMNLSVLLRRLLGSKVHLELDLESPGRMVRVDPTQLDQVLVNLAVNARDAMPEGGRLTLHTGHITLYRPLVRGPETIPPARYVMVEVQDTGAGIPPEILPRIFDPFFTTKREQGGSGLGLSTVHGIVRQSGGYLAVESEPGRGATFRIYLPRYDTLAAASLPPPPPPPLAPKTAPPAGRTVLLVDDEDGVRRLALRALTNRGWTVVDADSGEAAIALLQADPALVGALCAIVSDVVMPGMDGPALVQAVRALRPGIPAILASGYAGDAVREGLAMDDVVFLAKPYVLKAMLQTLEQRALPSLASTERSSPLITP